MVPLRIAFISLRQPTAQETQLITETEGLLRDALEPAPEIDIVHIQQGESVVADIQKALADPSIAEVYLPGTAFADLTTMLEALVVRNTVFNIVFGERGQVWTRDRGELYLN